MQMTFTVLGDPVPKGRPRFRMATGTTYTPKKTKQYEQLVREAWLAQSGRKFDDGEAIKLTLVAILPIPRSYSKRLRQFLPGKPHIKKPDTDNLLKSVTDGLNGFAFSDDCQIAEVVARKEYGDIPRAIITLETIES